MRIKSLSRQANSAATHTDLLRILKTSSEHRALFFLICFTYTDGKWAKRATRIFIVLKSQLGVAERCA